MKTLLLSLNSYFNIKYLIFNINYIILYKLIKYNINYKYILLYIKNNIKSLFFNLKNKINSTKSNNKNSKTYYLSSHIARKGLVWFGARQLNLKSYNNMYNKLLVLNIFNFRSNIIIYNLELIKFLYYFKILNKKNIKLFLSNIVYFNNYIIFNAPLLYQINNNNLIY